MPAISYPKSEAESMLLSKYHLFSTVLQKSEFLFAIRIQRAVAHNTIVIVKL